MLESRLICFDRREIFREAVFLCITPWDTDFCSAATASTSFSFACSPDPLAMAERSRVTAVLDLVR